MLFKSGLGFGWWRWAHVACGREIRYVVVRCHPRCCGMRCQVAAKAVKVAWARIVDHLALRAAVTAWRKGSGLWRVFALARWRRTLQLLRSSILQFHRQKRPSGNSLAGQGLGTSVLWTFVHRGAPCQRIVLYAAAVQPGWSRMKQWWHRWPTSFFRGGNHPSFFASSNMR